MKYICKLCGWEYGEEEGCPEGDILPDTTWDALPDDFECPICCVGKDHFFQVNE